MLARTCVFFTLLTRGERLYRKMLRRRPPQANDQLVNQKQAHLDQKKVELNRRFKGARAAQKYGVGALLGPEAADHNSLFQSQGLGDNESLRKRLALGLRFTDMIAHQGHISDRIAPPASYNAALRRKMVEGALWAEAPVSPQQRVAVPKQLRHEQNMSATQRGFCHAVLYHLRRNM